MTATLQIPTTLIREMGQEIGFLREDIERLKRGQRATQLQNASVENGAITFFDDHGVRVATLGKLAEGVYNTEYYNAAVPPQPNTPDLEPFGGGINVTWDGTFVNGTPIPKNFRFVEVYRLSAANGIPGTGNFIGTLSEAGTIPDAGLDSNSTYYYLFIATNNAEKAVGTGVRATASTPSMVASAQPGLVVGQDILDGIVTETKLAAEAVSQAKIKVGAVGTAQLGDQVVTLANLANGSVNALKLVDSSITGDKIAPLAIRATEISDAAITGPKIQASAVEADKIAANAVTANKIAAGAVEADKVAANAITAGKIAANAVGADQIAANSIIAGKVAANAIGANEIAAGAISANKIAAEAVDATKIAAQAITADKLAALAVTADKVAANAIQAGNIAAGAVTAAKLETNLLLTSRIVAGSLTGARVEMHFSSGLQAFNASGQRTFWVNAASGQATFVGEVSTAFSGSRISLNPGGNNQDTILLYPASGSAYAGITAFDAGNGFGGIVLYGSASNNNMSTNRGMVVVRRDYASLINGRPDLSFWGSEVWVEPTFTRNKSAVVDLIIDERLSDPSRRVAMVRWSSTGAVQGGTILQYQPTQFNGGEPTWHATGQDSGLVFAPGRLYVRNNGNTQPRAINASAFEVNSSETVKEEIAEVTLPEGRSSWDLVEGAASQDWKYLAERPTARGDKPRDINGKPIMGRKRNPDIPSYVDWESIPDDHPDKWVDVEAEYEWEPQPQKKHRYPLAEDLEALDPDIVRVDETTGEKSVDLRDSIGILWDAVDMLIKRNRLLEEQLNKVKGISLPKRPQKGDVVRGAGAVKPGRTLRNLDSTGQVIGRAKELVASTASFAMDSSGGGNDSLMIRESTIDPIIPTGTGGLFARDGVLYWKNTSGQVKRIA